MHTTQKSTHMQDTRKEALYKNYKV